MESEHMQGATGFVFHHANAYETQDGCVVVDAIRYPTLPDFEQACGSGRNFIQVRRSVFFQCSYAAPSPTFTSCLTQTQSRHSPSNACSLSWGTVDWTLCFCRGKHVREELLALLLCCESAVSQRHPRVLFTFAVNQTWYLDEMPFQTCAGGCSADVSIHFLDSGPA